MLRCVVLNVGEGVVMSLVCAMFRSHDDIYMAEWSVATRRECRYASPLKGQPSLVACWFRTCEQVCVCCMLPYE